MIGERIRQARLLAGYTQEEVAVKLTDAGLSATKAVISKYENNKSVPPASVLLALSQLHGVPSSYFMYEPDTDVEWLAYRKHSALPAKIREAIQSYARDAASLHIELRNLLYPKQVYKLPAPAQVTHIKDAESVAENLREAWNLNDLPVENLTQTAEENGVVVLAWQYNAGRFDGLSGWYNETVPVTVINTGVDVDRRRFNLAHELGHLLMQVPDELSEKTVHRFAAAFLVPAEVAYRELGRKRHSISLAELGALKRRYGLSIQGWIFRATDLGIITQHFASSLWREINQRGWKKTEPFPYIADEEPVLLHQMILHAVAEGLVTADHIRQVLPDFSFEDSIVDNGGFPTPTELLAMSSEDREKWLERSFEHAKDEDFEHFEAFGEEEF